MPLSSCDFGKSGIHDRVLVVLSTHRAVEIFSRCIHFTAVYEFMICFILCTGMVHLVKRRFTEMALYRMPPLIMGDIGKQLVFVACHTLSDERFHQVYCGETQGYHLHLIAAADEGSPSDVLDFYFVAAGITVVSFILTHHDSLN